MITFKEDDAGFIRWCEEHPDGFVLNSREGTAASVLHSATYNGKLCPHFRNQKHAFGHEHNLTKNPKVCAITREELEAKYSPRRCPQCTGVS